VPLVLVVMNIVYAAGAYPVGVLADTGRQRRLLAMGLLVLCFADVVLASATGVAGALFGAALWGLHMAFTQGLLSALVADTAPPDLRGTAFGLFNLLTGFALLAASLIAGHLWDAVGARSTFLGGAWFAGAALLGLLVLPVGRRHA
jgi:MFS family permease